VAEKKRPPLGKPISRIQNSLHTAVLRDESRRISMQAGGMQEDTAFHAT
jgi:hypothetical protein